MDEELITPEATQIVDQQMPTPEPQLTQEQVVAQTMDQQRVDNYNAKGYAIKNWIDNDYDYNPSDIGNLWVAGAISDANTQVSFLEATLNEDMYSEQDIGKYYFDQNLAIARAYAKEKKHETMYGYYKAAQEKALAEADLTGWYMPPEAAYMLSQWVTAEENLKRDDLNDIDRARAESVVRASESWFAANNITRQGIETLSRMYLEETIRHNREVEALYDLEVEIEKIKTANAQTQANQAAREADYEIRFRELGSGMDLNDDGVIGFGGSEWEGRFASYDDMKEWAIDHPMTAQTIMGTSGLQILFGDRYEEDFLVKYNNELHTQKVDQAASTNNGVLDTGNVPASGAKISSNDKNYGKYSDKNIYYVIYDGEIRYYVNTGTADNKVFEQITNIDGVQLQDGTNLDQFSSLTFTDKALTTRDGSIINVGSNIDYTKMDGSYTKNPEHYPGIGEKEGKTITEYEKQGYRIANGYIDLDGLNAGIVMYIEDKEGNRTYIAIHTDGSVKEVKDESKLLYATYENGELVWKRADGKDLSFWQKGNLRDYQDLYIENQRILYEVNGEKRQYIIDSNGKMVEFTGERFVGSIFNEDRSNDNDYSDDLQFSEDSSTFDLPEDTIDDFNDYRDGKFNVIDDHIKPTKKKSSGGGGKGAFGGGGSMGGRGGGSRETTSNRTKPAGRTNNKYKYTNREILDYEENGKIKEEEDKKKGDKR